MKRYFDLPEKKQVVEFDIIEGSQAATASEKDYGIMMKTKVKEIDRHQYNTLKRQYGSCAM
jgi:hypothetical protein